MASNNTPRPRQGEIWLTAFGAAKVGEPGKTRPAIVLTGSDQMTGSAYDLVVMVPISSTLPTSPVRPLVPASARTGLAADSVAVVRALRGMAPTRLLACVGQVDTTVLREIGEILGTLIEVDDSPEAP